MITHVWLDSSLITSWSFWSALRLRQKMLRPWFWICLSFSITFCFGSFRSTRELYSSLFNHVHVTTLIAIKNFFLNAECPPSSWQSWRAMFCWNPESFYGQDLGRGQPTLVLMLDPILDVDHQFLEVFANTAEQIRSMLLKSVSLIFCLYIEQKVRSQSHLHLPSNFCVFYMII